VCHFLLSPCLMAGSFTLLLRKILEHILAGGRLDRWR
jgi:hypothetical protein